MSEAEPDGLAVPAAGSPDIYLAVLGRIQRNEIADDAKIVDTALAKEFQVSRMPARQALLRLVHEGYLVGTTRGFALPQLSDRDVADIFDVRLLLEPRAAASACPLLLADDLFELESALAAATEASAQGRVNEMMAANDRFRQVWLAKVPNERLASAIQRFADHVRIVRRKTFIDPAAQKIVLALSRDLLAAFVRKDALQVYDLVAELLRAARQSYFIASQVHASDGTGRTTGKA